MSAPGVSVYRRGARMRSRWCVSPRAHTRQSDSDNSRRGRIPPSGNQNAYPSSVLKQARYCSSDQGRGDGIGWRVSRPEEGKEGRSGRSSETWTRETDAEERGLGEARPFGALCSLLVCSPSGHLVPLHRQATIPVALSNQASGRFADKRQLTHCDQWRWWMRVSVTECHLSLFNAKKRPSLATWIRYAGRETPISQLRRHDVQNRSVSVIDAALPATRVTQ